VWIVFGTVEIAGRWPTCWMLAVPFAVEAPAVGVVRVTESDLDFFIYNLISGQQVRR
jgi:hypothetical protein